MEVSCKFWAVEHLHVTEEEANKQIFWCLARIFVATAKGTFLGHVGYTF